MKMPMTDMSGEHKGGIDKEVREDTKSGPGHPSEAKAAKSGGPGVKGGRMSKACSTLSKMKA